MRFDVISIFPDFVDAVTQFGVTGRAVDQQLLQMNAWDLRDYADNVHRNVDDRPYGGGPGMVMTAEPLAKAVAAIKEKLNKPAKVVLLSPQGKRLNQGAVKVLSEGSNIILIAGRYEGIDERFVDQEVDEEWSIGDYVISGGELAAMVVIDAVARMLPGVLGDAESAEQDSFMQGLLDCPHYTRPEKWRGQKVPDVLLSGDHQQIAAWRRKQALGRTWHRRSDLLESVELSDEDKASLQNYQKSQIMNKGSSDC